MASFLGRLRQGILRFTVRERDLQVSGVAWRGYG